MKKKKTRKKQQKQQTKTEEKGRTEAIVKEWELNNFAMHLS